MTIKTPVIRAPILIIMLISVSFLFVLPSGFAAAAETKVTVRDVEYLRGEDFVQLRFITDKIISIPDVFYPDEADTTRLVMRIGDVDFNVGRESFRFESPVIERVDFRRNEKYIDVEIRLKEKVNYRVFTNRNGLYIEFPNLKRSRAKAVPQAQQYKNSVKPGASLVRPALSTGRNTIKDIRVAERSAERLKIEFHMAAPVEYHVIPIADAPVRLAIDLQDTRARQLKKAINHLNVKTIRGGPNTPSVFRLVFDLHYLKSYSVSLNKNVLEVEFFNVKSLARNKRKPAAAEKEAGTEKKNADNAPKNKVKGRTITNADIKPIEEITPPQVQISRRENSDEFFSAEKSLVTGNPQEARRTQAPAEKPAENAALFQKRMIKGEKKWTGELRSYHLKDQDLQNLLIHFARESGISMVFDPGISGSVTAELNDVPWDQALDIFLRQNGLSKQREGNVIRIARVERIEQEAEQRRKMRESLRKEVELDTATRGLNYAIAKDVKKILDKSLTSRGTILVDDRSNTLIISEIPENFDLLDGLIKALDTPTPQVSIEAKIIETNANFTRNLGIQWGFNFIADAAYGNQTSLVFPNSVRVQGERLTGGIEGPLGGYAVNLPAASVNSAVVFSLGNVTDSFRLDAALSAMQSKGKGKIIQSPRFLTQNNTEAVIRQGYKIPVQTLQNNTITVVYREVVLELKVTPTITADDTITMAVDLKNDNVDWGRFVKDTPAMLTQSAKTTVKAKNGETIVIGGMYKIETGSTTGSVPFLHKIPLLGNLFKNTLRSSQQRETLIFITPRIVK
ncbi:MAG: type IV pilus secretin PilQ [Candidatus Aminicenantes bacterium]|nr:type IV pilus secretin PilQ [Candidatus Aminicenantes bacterium]